VGSTSLWLTIGFVGQALFTARFLVQWAASERRRDAVVPVAFWWLSLLGGLALLAYAIARRDPVIVVGQVLGMFVYTRNLMLINKARRPSGRAGGDIPGGPAESHRAGARTPLIRPSGTFSPGASPAQ
jgi:lipid-A-disaccharide synthase-like uncharacterized protein